MPFINVFFMYFCYSFVIRFLYVSYTFRLQIYKQVSIIQNISIKMSTFFKRLLQVVENEKFKNINDFALNGLKYDSSSKLNRLKDDNKKPSVEILEDIANKVSTYKFTLVNYR